MNVDIFTIAGHDPKAREAVEAGRDFDDLATVITSLVAARKSQKITQTEVAEILGTTQSAVSDIERISGNPTIRTLQSYARAVGCELRLLAIVSGSKAEPVEHPIQLQG